MQQLSIDRLIASITGASVATSAESGSNGTLAETAVHLAAYTLATAYAALVRGEVIPPALLADDVNFWIRGETERIPFAGTWTGPQQVASLFKTLAENVRFSGITPRYHMIQENEQGIHLMLFALEEGTAVPTGRTFSSESVHDWKFDQQGRVRYFASYHNSFDFTVAFSSIDLDPTIAYRHPLPQEVISPTASCAGDPAAAARLFYERLDALDLEGLIGLFAEDAVSTLEGYEGANPFAGTYHGKESLRRQCYAMQDSIVPFEAELEIPYIEDGNRACVRFMDVAVARSTNLPMSFRNIHFFSVNDEGKITMFRSYNHTWHVANALGFRV